MSDLGHWVNKLGGDSKATGLTITECFTVEDDNTPFGFIYEIVNNATGKMYIGKKQMISKKKRPPLKGKKNKRHYTVESDWKTYCGSCNDLLDDIKKIGKDQFSFYIIKYCNSKWELAYFEAKEQIDREVLFDDMYYNGMCNLRIGKAPTILRKDYKK